MVNPDIKETKAQLTIKHLAEFADIIYVAEYTGEDKMIGTLEQIKSELISDGETVIYDTHGCTDCIEITTHFNKENGEIVEMVWSLTHPIICGDSTFDGGLMHSGVWV